MVTTIYVALSQLINHDDFSFEASIALMILFSFSNKSLISASRVLVSHCEVQDYNSLSTGNIIRGYVRLLEYVICPEEFPTEWNCMDVISLCLPIIDKFIDSASDYIYEEFVSDTNRPTMLPPMNRNPKPFSEGR